MRFVDGHPQLSNGERLTLANDEQRREFFQLRRRENDETDFKYPSISYVALCMNLPERDTPPIAIDTLLAGESFSVMSRCAMRTASCAPIRRAGAGSCCARSPWRRTSR